MKESRECGREVLRGDARMRQGIYMVVSDKNAKWKGEPIPLPVAETKGHW